jgi:hypothetical protein
LHGPTTLVSVFRLALRKNTPKSTQNRYKSSFLRISDIFLIFVQSRFQYPSWIFVYHP